MIAALSRTLSVALLATVAAAQHATIPAASSATDADSALLLPGFELAARMQILVDPAHMPAGATGATLTSLAFRRDFAFTGVANGGVADLTITLSISPRTANTASESMGANAAQSPQSRVVVHQGLVTIPTSTDPTTRTPDWSDLQDVVAIPFQTPFAYPGGTLCIDIEGAPVSPTGYWPVDAAVDDVSGQVADVGESCGDFGGRKHSAGPFLSAFVAPRGLVPGATVRFRAFGERSLPGAAILGTQPVAFDLHAFGIGAAGCTLHVGDPIVLPVVFADPSLPAFTGGEARLAFQIPAAPILAGTGLRAQFVELSTPLRTSNALDCTIASRLPALGMSTVFAWTLGVQAPQTGRVDPTKAPVMRMSWQ